MSQKQSVDLSLIDKLSKEQRELIPVYRDKWLRVYHGLGTDRERAEVALARLYKQFDKPPPQTVWFDNPLEGAIAAAVLGQDYDKRLSLMMRNRNVQAVSLEVGLPSNMAYDIEPIRSVRNQLWPIYLARPHAASVAMRSLAETVDTMFRNTQMALNNGIAPSTQAQIASSIMAVEGNVMRTLKRHLRKSMQVVDPEVTSQAIADSISETLGQACYGCHEADWLGFYDYLWHVLGFGSIQKLQPLFALAKTSGWFWVFEDVAIMTDQPGLTSLNEQGSLHNETGPAMAWDEAYQIYAIGGIQLNEQIVMRPKTLTIEQIMQETNAEVRRIMVERMGWERYFKLTGMTRVHEDEFGTLYKSGPIPGEREELCLVRVRNGTPEGEWQDGGLKEIVDDWGRKLTVPEREFVPKLDERGELVYKYYYLRVPPDTVTARQAVAWTYWLTDPNVYNPTIRT